MTVPTTSWDETSPAGSDNISAGDNRIREMKTQIREVVNVDHDFPSSGSASDNGQHKQVTLQEQADLGTGAVNATILGSQTTSGKGELVYTDEDDNDIQITKSGTIYPGSLGTTLSDWSNILKLVYPVGSVYTNASDSTNPATLLGFGSWSAIEGECVVGLKSGDSDFGSVGSVTNGEKTHTLTASESGLPAHNHSVSASNGAGSSTMTFYEGGRNTGVSFNTNNVSAASASSAHNNIQPSYVCYVWRRTA